MPNLVCLCQRAKTTLTLSIRKIHVYNIKFDIKAKDQGHTEVTNLCDTCTRYGMPVNKQKAMAQT